MFIDAQLLFSDAQAVTADARSTNVVDLGVGRTLFDGEPLAIVIVIDVGADYTTTDETYAFQVRTDDNSSMSSPTVVSTTTISAASSGLAAGKRFVLPIPIGVAIERYLEVYYDVGGTTPSLTVTAFLQPLSMIDKFRTYPDAVTIS